jgi:hypothetical protein
LTKNGLDYILGDFSQAHLVTLLCPLSPVQFEQVFGKVFQNQMNDWIRVTGSLCGKCAY